jgi:hypothetical protein
LDEWCTSCCFGWIVYWLMVFRNSCVVTDAVSSVFSDQWKFLVSPLITHQHYEEDHFWWQCLTWSRGPDIFVPRD